MGNTQQKVAVSLLRQSAARGDLTAVQSCINAKVDVNECDEVGQTALHLACRFGHFSCAKLLLDNGAKVNQQTERWKWTPMHIIARYGCDFEGDKAEQLIQLLLDQKADMNVQNPSGITPLHRANCYNQNRIVEALVARGADLNLTTRWGRPPLHPGQRFSITSSLALQAVKTRTKSKDSASPGQILFQKANKLCSSMGEKSARPPKWQLHRVKPTLRKAPEHNAHSASETVRLASLHSRERRVSFDRLGTMSASEFWKIRRKVAAVEEENQKRKTLDQDYVRCGVRLGDGGTSEVMRVRRRNANKSDPNFYALKEISLREYEAEHIAVLRKEVQLLKQLDHPNIVRLVNSYDHGGTLQIVLELCRGGDILSFQRKRQPLPIFTEIQAAHIMKQMLSAVAYLHHKGVVHRDLKLENFLFKNEPKDADNPGDIKMIDFGFSEIFWNKPKMTLAVGTAGYMAPEMVDKKEEKTGYDRGVDMWSLGVVAYILMCGYAPFFRKTREESFQAIMTGKFIKQTRWKALGPLAQKFIKSLLEKNKSKRLTAVQARRHTWIVENCGRQVNYVHDISATKLPSKELIAYAIINPLKSKAKDNADTAGL